MLNKAVFTTNTHEIHLTNKDEEGWVINVFKIKYGVKEIFETRYFKNLLLATIYIEDEYLKDLKVNHLDGKQKKEEVLKI